MTDRMLSRWPLGLAAAAALAVPSARPLPLHGQTIQGAVSSADTGAPVAGAFVSLLDQSGAHVAAFLTDASGRFRVRADRPGLHDLTVRMIGLGTHSESAIDLADGAVLTREIRLSVAPIVLDEIVASGDRVCRFDVAEAAQAVVLWEEARTALEVLRWTSDSDALTYRLALGREVRAEGTGRVIEASLDTVATRGTTPFDLGDADSLFTHGFVLPGPGGGPVYYGPDAAMLLSDRFVDTHCFRVARDGAEVGLAFEPKPDREVTDLAGVIWLDAGTGQLRRVEFRYEGGRAVTTGARGEVGFRRLADGRWIIRSWRLRAPIVGGDAFSRHRRTRILAFEEAHGEVIEVEDSRGR